MLAEVLQRQRRHSLLGQGVTKINIQTATFTMDYHRLKQNNGTQLNKYSSQRKITFQMEILSK